MWNLELPSRSIAVVVIEASICVALNITGFIGNSLVCIAAYKHLNLRSNLYIIALAVSDLLVATIEMPLTSSTLIVGKWDFGNALCQIQGFIAEFAYYVTPATLSLIAFNRYVKIVKTNHYNKIFSPRRSKIWLSCLWLFLALYLLIVRVTNWITINFVQSFALCAFSYPSDESQIVHYCLTFGLLFVVPLCIGTFSYYNIFLKTNEHQQNVVSSLQNRTNNGALNNSVRETNLTRMLFIVAVGFLCSWIPMWAKVLWFRLSPETCPRIAALHQWCVPEGISKIALLLPWKGKNSANR